MYTKVSLGREPGMRAKGTLLIYTCALSSYRVCSSAVISCPWRSVAMVSVLLSVCMSVRFVERSSINMSTRLCGIWRIRKVLRRTRFVNLRLTWWSMTNKEGLPHKVNLGLTLWLVPGCLVQQGCVDEAEKFQPGAEISNARVCFQSLGHQDSSRASAPDSLYSGSNRCPYPIVVVFLFS